MPIVAFVTLFVVAMAVAGNGMRAGASPYDQVAVGPAALLPRTGVPDTVIGRPIGAVAAVGAGGPRKAATVVTAPVADLAPTDLVLAELAPAVRTEPVADGPRHRHQHTGARSTHQTPDHHQTRGSQPVRTQERGRAFGHRHGNDHARGHGNRHGHDSGSRHVRSHGHGHGNDRGSRHGRARGDGPGHSQHRHA